MKNSRRFKIAAIMMTGIFLCVQLNSLAAEPDLKEHICEDESIRLALEASGYRCPNCNEYLEERRKIGTCAYCTFPLHSYECPSCGEWVAICEVGHYHKAYGR
ncbi:MAG: hypothetical protein Q4C58_03900 [Eubacteriales bacterium]|nr:hypothetical protein [Eubacteriales bacterium]